MQAQLALPDTQAPVAATASSDVQQPQHLKVFIANLGGEYRSSIPGGTRTYNAFYAAMKRSGQYELVADPAQADLIFELLYTLTWHCVPQDFHFKEPRGHGKVRYHYKESFYPNVKLNVWDRKTGTAWGTFDADAKFAYLRSNYDKNFDEAIELLVRRASSGPAQPQPVAENKSQEPANAPAPYLLARAKSVFISSEVKDKTGLMKNPAEIYAVVYAAINQWGRYKLVSSPAEADMMIDLAVDQQRGPRCEGSNHLPEDRIELRFVVPYGNVPNTPVPNSTVPKTNIALWGFAQKMVVSQKRDKPFSASTNAVQQTAVALLEQIRELVARAEAEAAPGKASAPAPQR